MFVPVRGGFVRCHPMGLGVGHAAIRRFNSWKTTMIGRDLLITLGDATGSMCRLLYDFSNATPGVHLFLTLCGARNSHHLRVRKYDFHMGLHAARANTSRHQSQWGAVDKNVARRRMQGRRETVSYAQCPRRTQTRMQRGHTDVDRLQPEINDVTIGERWWESALRKWRRSRARWRRAEWWG